MLDVLEEGISFFGIVPELVAKDAKTAGCVPEPLGDNMGRLAVEEEGPKRFVLPMEGLFGRGKKTRLRRLRYLIAMSDSHILMLLYSTRNVNILWSFP